MKTSANGRSFIEAFEGKFLHTYDDGTGVLTIGYGHTTAAGPPKVVRGMKITDEECDNILADDLAAVDRDVSRLIHVPMTQPQFDALVSFHFNTGKLGAGSIDDKINSGRSAAAMQTLLLYDHAKGRQMDGLTRRRKAEKLMFDGAVLSAMRLAGAHVLSGDTMPQAPEARPIPVPPPPDIRAPKPAPAPLPWFVRLINAIFRRS